MRRALVNYQPITTVHGQSGFGYFGKHAGYDYGVVKQPVVAPEGGVITNTKIAPTADGGSIVELRSNKYDHRFLHLDSIAVKKGQTVREGQKLGVSGNTGNVGYHLHHDTRKKGTVWTASYSNYVDWEKLIKGEKDVSKIDRPRAIRLLRLTRRGTDEKRIQDLIGQDEDKWLDSVYKASWFKDQTAKINNGAKALKDKIISFVKGA